MFVLVKDVGIAHLFLWKCSMLFNLLFNPLLRVAIWRENDNGVYLGRLEESIAQI